MRADGQTLVNLWIDRIREDLTGFADPATDVEVSRDGNVLAATWEQRGHQHQERFRLSQEGDFRWIGAEDELRPYRTFLTSPEMADFEQLANAMSKVFEPRGDFVATDARTEEADGSPVEIEASPAVIRDQIIEARTSAEGRTGLFFIKGDAGSGKTTLLRELTAAQADKYCRGDTRFLFFFVSAQGRALSNLRDIFSSELQAIRAGFTRDAIPALARANLLVPIIDGFDELLGTAGYGDAFSSLRHLLIELQGLGAVVVSARSAFYNVEFVSRTPEFVTRTPETADDAASITLRPVSLLPWNEEKLDRYLRLRRPQSDHARDRLAVSGLDERDQRLLMRPFFASEFPGYVDAHEGGDGSPDSLLDYLIEAYISRETHKVIGASGDPLLSTSGHHTLLEEAAELMWQNEKRQLSVAELQTLVEMVAEEEGLGGSESGQIITKVTSSAGFRTSTPEGAGQFSFDHEVYFEYFLAKTLERQIGAANGLGQFFDRGVLPDDVIDAAVQGNEEQAVVADVLSTTSTALRHENRRRNAGAVLAAWTRHHGPLEDAGLRNLSFIDVNFGGATFRRVAFENCDFTGSRLDRATFEDCDAASSRFQGIVVTNESRLDMAGIVPGANFGSLIHPDVEREVFSPEDVAKILRELGTPLPGAPERRVKYSSQATVLLKLLEIMARAYRRSNVLFDTDEYMARLFQNEHWPRLRSELAKHGIVREETRSASGPKARVYRLLVGIDDLVNSENAVELPDGPIGAFWSSLRRM